MISFADLMTWWYCTGVFLWKNSMRNFAEFFSQASRFFSFDIVEIRTEKIGEINQAQKFSSRFSISVFSCLLDRFSRFGHHIGMRFLQKLSNDWNLQVDKMNWHSAYRGAFCQILLSLKSLTFVVLTWAHTRHSLDFL